MKRTKTIAIIALAVLCNLFADAETIPNSTSPDGRFICRIGDQSSSYSKGATAPMIQITNRITGKVLASFLDPIENEPNRRNLRNRICTRWRSDSTALAIHFGSNAKVRSKAFLVTANSAIPLTFPSFAEMTEHRFSDEEIADLQWHETLEGWTPTGRIICGICFESLPKKLAQRPSLYRWSLELRGHEFKVAEPMCTIFFRGEVKVGSEPFIFDSSKETSTSF